MAAICSGTVNTTWKYGATYPYATVVFTGTPAAGNVVSFTIGGRRLGTARFRLAGHDGGRAQVDSRSRQPVRGGGHPGVVRVLDRGLQSAGRDARQVFALCRRRRLHRPGRVPWRPLPPDALRHARPDIPQADVQ